MAEFSSENDLIDWLRRRWPRLGDDAALLPALGDHAISVDSQREGVHFRSSTPAWVIARRLCAVNLSDLAAVGAVPRYALCTLAAPRNFRRRQFFEALTSSCTNSGLELVGGDLSSADRVECTLTVIGTRVPRGRFLRRSSAQPGQDLFIASSAHRRLGQAHLGLRLMNRSAEVDDAEVASTAGIANPGKGTEEDEPLRLRLPVDLPDQLAAYATSCLITQLLPEPLVPAGQWLARRRSAVAAMDLSDGLAVDLPRLAVESRVDIALLEAAISVDEKPADQHAEEFAGLCAFLGENPRAVRLTGGEDYALVFTGSDSVAEALAKASPVPELLVSKIGRIEEPQRGVSVEVEGHHRRDLADYLHRCGAGAGWDHLS